MKSKLYFVFAVFFSAFFCLAIRVLYLKVCYGKEYTQMAINQQINGYDVTLTAKRGEILDRNKNVLSKSIPIYDIILEPQTLIELNSASKSDETQKTLSSLSNILSIPINELNEYISFNSDGSLKYSPYYEVIAKSIDSKTAEKIRSLNLKGVYIEEKQKRYYPYNDQGSKVIGLSHGGSLYGIENTYNYYLTGKDGRSFKQINNSSSQIVTIPPEDGCTVVSTIDINLQKIASDGVKEAMEMFPCQYSSVIMMNPITGEILAMADSYDFDLNNPSKPINMTQEKYNTLTPQEQSEYLSLMWKNYNISSTFEPGSIFKPLLTGAALDEKNITNSTTFYCAGFKQIEDRKIHCIRRTGHFAETLEEAISSSCNCAMMDIVEKMGRNKFYEYQKSFGFGEKSGIDLPFEESASSLIYSKEELGPVELATCSFGQSFNATALQSLTALCSIANGGKLMQPYVVSAVIDKNGNTIKENKPQIRRYVLSESSCELVKKYMVTVVNSGTGKKAKIDGYNIAGKSGTGEQGDRSQDMYTITFAGFLPAENPSLAAIVVIHKPEEYADGVTTAAPIFKNIIEKSIKYLCIEPSYNAQNSSSAQGIFIKNYILQNTTEAEKELSSMDINYQILGNGKTVINQFPKEGSLIDSATEVLLYTNW